MLDSNRENTYELPKSDEVWEVVAPAGTVVSLAVPASPSADAPYVQALISASNNVFVNTETFALPSSSTFVQGGAELNKPMVPLTTGNDTYVDTLYFIAPEECYITVSFFTGYVRLNNPLGT